MNRTRFALIALALAALATSALAQTTWRLGHIRDVNHPTHAGAVRFAELVEEKTEGASASRSSRTASSAASRRCSSRSRPATWRWSTAASTPWRSSAGRGVRDHRHPLPVPRLRAHARGAAVRLLRAGLRRGRSQHRDPPSSTSGRHGARAGSRPTGRSMVRTTSSACGSAPPPARWCCARCRRLGALPQQVPFADLYVALRTGVVDAQENGAITVVNASLYEVQPYYMVTDYIRDIETFYVEPRPLERGSPMPTGPRSRRPRRRPARWSPSSRLSSWRKPTPSSRRASRSSASPSSTCPPSAPPSRRPSSTGTARSGRPGCWRPSAGM
jgi:TRAP-type transport system periplasmic protein